MSDDILDMIDHAIVEHEEDWPDAMRWSAEAEQVAPPAKTMLTVPLRAGGPVFRWYFNDGVEVELTEPLRIPLRIEFNNSQPIDWRVYAYRTALPGSIELSGYWGPG